MLSPVILCAIAIPIQWSNIWNDLEHFSQVFLPFTMTANVVLPYMVDLEGYRLDQKTKDMIYRSGGKTYIQRINHENFEFIEDPFGGVVRRSLRHGRWLFKYNGTDYYYHQAFRVWVNSKTNISFQEEHPDLYKQAHLEKQRMLNKVMLDRLNDTSSPLNHTNKTWHVQENITVEKKGPKLYINWPMLLHPLDDIPWGRILTSVKGSKLH